ncbi:MAG: hypothetical protein QM755_01610 [Luteolibacter sp.]
MKRLPAFFTPLLLLYLLVSCQKRINDRDMYLPATGPALQETPAAQVLPPAVIHAVGWETVGSEVAAARYWKNGSAVPFLNDPLTPSKAGGIALSGSIPYVSFYQDNSNRASYWRNGNIVLLGDGQKKTMAANIALSGNEVYVPGLERVDNSYNSIARYWKNGVAVNLSSGLTRAAANDIAIVVQTAIIGGHPVSVKTIYAAGKEDITPDNANYNMTARYWKNGTAVSLTNGQNDAEALAIFVAGTDTYVAGWESTAAGKHVAKYWKNGIPVNLTNGSSFAEAHAITVVDGVVYVAGYEYNNASGRSVAKYWKNGIAVNLASALQHSRANAITMVKDNVYTGGSFNGFPAYWKNGVLTLLNASVIGECTDIAVE